MAGAVCARSWPKLRPGGCRPVRVARMKNNWLQALRLLALLAGPALVLMLAFGGRVAGASCSTAQLGSTFGHTSFTRSLVSIDSSALELEAFPEVNTNGATLTLLADDCALELSGAVVSDSSVSLVVYGARSTSVRHVTGGDPLIPLSTAVVSSTQGTASVLDFSRRANALLSLSLARIGQHLRC